ncbi:hypothetical protein F4801DRAFT_599831 [Xylaria longipes]|nr:hypothetical protein F4801DRAFT_599831 [Xylaria longipes]
MASEKAFEFKAFDLTSGEKHESLGEIKSLLLLAGSRIQRAKTFGASQADWHDILRLVNQALVIAKDPDACDTSLAPLVSCYLYKGHILLALGQEQKAYDAYEKAATGEAHALTDFPAVQQAARLLLELRNRPRDTGSTAPRNPPQNSSNPRGGNGGSAVERPDSLFLPSGIDEIPLLVTIRPGPGRRRPNETSGPNKTSANAESRA